MPPKTVNELIIKKDIINYIFIWDKLVHKSIIKANMPAFVYKPQPPNSNNTPLDRPTVSTMAARV